MKKLFDIAEKGIELADKLTVNKDEKNRIKKEIILAEVNSDSKFLRNARPSIIYFGLLVVLLELLGLRFFLLNLFMSEELYKNALASSESILQFFLITWGSITTAYVVGRSQEKRANKLFKK
tara:strand:+ start:341 stop:706 length:366 start_codon:yes stop_codon:yes gene_type:complete